MEFLYSMAKVNIGVENKTCFLNAPWVDGISLKTIASSIFTLSKKRELSQ
jgi:hypothetical protein